MSIIDNIRSGLGSLLMTTGEGIRMSTQAGGAKIDGMAMVPVEAAFEAKNVITNTLGSKDGLPGKIGNKLGTGAGMLAIVGALYSTIVGSMIRVPADMLGGAVSGLGQAIKGAEAVQEPEVK